MKTRNIIGGLGILAGCLGCLDPKPLTIEDVQNEISLYGPGSIKVYKPEGFAQEAFLWDSNQDGTIDALGSIGGASWYASNYVGKKGWDAKLMTPEIRDLATQYAALGKSLALKLFEEELRQELKQGEQK